MSTKIYCTILFFMNISIACNACSLPKTDHEINQYIRNSHSSTIQLDALFFRNFQKEAPTLKS